MKLNFITLLVRDIKKSVVFYRELAGLKSVREIKMESAEIIFLANNEGETMIELVQLGEGEKVATKGMVMSFAVNGDPEIVREKAKEMGYSPSEILLLGQKPPHFTVKDPDGIVVEFM